MIVGSDKTLDQFLMEIIVFLTLVFVFVFVE